MATVRRRHPYLIAYISCPELEGQPAWRDRLEYDDDLYVSLVGPIIKERLDPILGWSVWSVEAFCLELGFTYEEKWSYTVG